MKNSDISKILQEANNNNIYLWDLPRPKWTQEDFDVLDAIKNGAKYKTKKLLLDNLNDYVSMDNRICQPNRTIIKRIADNKIYNSSYECAYDNNISRTHLINCLKSDKEHRYKQMFQLI